MKIGLIGWYGEGNAGDDRILACLRSNLLGHELVVATVWKHAYEMLPKLNACDYVLFGGGGLIQRGFGHHHELIDALTPRLGCVGLSVEYSHRDNQRIIRSLLSKSEFVLVRDNRSRELLEGHHKVIVGPDLTFLEPYRNGEQLEFNGQCAINLRPWTYWKFPPRSGMAGIMLNINRYYRKFHRVYPFAKWDPARFIDAIRDGFTEMKPLSLFQNPPHISDEQVLAAAGISGEAHVDPKMLLKCNYLVGMRLHSLIFATQMGIPFLSVSYQPKNVEFCRVLGIEQASIDPWESSRADIQRKIEWLKKECPCLREALLEYAKRASSEIQSIMDCIKLNIVNGTQARI